MRISQKIANALIRNSRKTEDGKTLKFVLGGKVKTPKCMTKK